MGRGDVCGFRGEGAEGYAVFVTLSELVTEFLTEIERIIQFGLHPAHEASTAFDDVEADL